MEGAFAGAFVLILALWIGLSFVGGRIWEGKGGSFGVGFVIVFFLGLVGLVIVAVANPGGSQVLAPTQGPRATRECPHCKEAMRRDASVCPHCRMESEPWTYNDGAWWILREGTWLRLDERTGAWMAAETNPPPAP